MKKKLYEGEAIKYGWGVAWRNYHEMSYTIYPIPFNLIARWIRELYFLVIRPPETKKDVIYHDGYNAGYKAATDYYERVIKDKDEEWSRTVGLAILRERGL